MASKNKIKTIFVCNNCGGTSLKWLGKCPHCDSWNTLVETIDKTDKIESKNRLDNFNFSKNLQSYSGQTQEVIELSEIKAEDILRIPTEISELDRVLGGGIVPAAVILIGGDPGIGKSTLLLQALHELQIKSNLKTLYVSGEESNSQVALRANRLGIKNSQVQLLAEIQLEKILATVENLKPDILVVDSIQTSYSTTLMSVPGSVAQVKECAAHLTRLAKLTGITVILVGHVTKDGSIAGPRVLEHMVDTVLYFEGDTNSPHRLIRAIKNRFGAVNEIGVFAMTEKGLKGINNPSAIFLSQHEKQVPGSCVLVTLEGSRPFLVEIQALTDVCQTVPRRLSVGLERDRLSMLLAVLSRHAKISCANFDVFVNAVGGVKISEPAADLAVILSITSSLQGKSLPKKVLAFGEVGLAGEIRPAPRGQERLKEAQKLGFTTAIIPKANAPKKEIQGLKIYSISRIHEAIEILNNF